MTEKIWRREDGEGSGGKLRAAGASYGMISNRILDVEISDGI